MPGGNRPEAPRVTPSVAPTYGGKIDVPKPDAILAYEKQFGTTMEPMYATYTRQTRGADAQVEYGPPIGYRFDNGNSQYVNFDATGTYQNTQNRERPGALGNIALSVLSIAYPPIAPFIQAYNAVKALDNGDTLGFILSAAGASAKIPGLDKSTSNMLKDVSTGARIIKAVESGDPVKILSATANIRGIDPDLKDLSIVVNTAKAVTDGNIAGAINGIARMSNQNSVNNIKERFNEIVAGEDVAKLDPSQVAAFNPVTDETLEGAPTNAGGVRSDVIDDTPKEQDAALQELNRVDVSTPARTEIEEFIPVAEEPVAPAPVAPVSPTPNGGALDRVTVSTPAKREIEEFIPVAEEPAPVVEEPAPPAPVAEEPAPPALERVTVSTPAKREIEEFIPVAEEPAPITPAPVTPAPPAPSGEELKLNPVTITGKREIEEFVPLQEMPPLPSSKVTEVIAGTPKEETKPIVLPSLPATPATSVKPVTPTQQPTSTAAAAADNYVDNLVKAGTGFNPSAEFDPYWFSEYQKRQKATKIASGGYLDDLLANPTSFEELLRTLRS